MIHGMNADVGDHLFDGAFPRMTKIVLTVAHLCHDTRCIYRADLARQGHSHEPLAQRQSCRVCGCTDDDASGCVERTGRPCHWVEPDRCGACAAYDRTYGAERPLSERTHEGRR
jgi:hypothetical protein